MNRDKDLDKSSSRRSRTEEENRNTSNISLRSRANSDGKKSNRGNVTPKSKKLESTSSPRSRRNAESENNVENDKRTLRKRKRSSSASNMDEEDDIPNDNISKRSKRSTKKRINYNDDKDDIILEDEVYEIVEEDEDDDLMDVEDIVSQIEKILAYRESKIQRKEEDYSDESKFYYEYLVKYKEQSYRKCEWINQKVIEGARLGKQRLKRFHNKSPELDPDPPFDPMYLEVDRIVSKQKLDGELHYLVKWQGLSYSECTWELISEINDEEKISEFNRINKIPSQKIDSNAPTVRPSPSEFKKIENIEFTNGKSLRSYQIEGVNWLRYCWYHNRNSILADEMGLGKTIQSVSILWYLHHYQNIRGPFLVIAPLSTIPHWRREFESWTTMNCIVYHGSTAAREIIRQYEWYYCDNDGKPKFKSMYKFNVIVTTYEMILTDTDIFKNIKWKYVVIDEAHRLKNKSSKVLNEFINFKYDHLLLLTGTPIQNNTQELWTLLNLIDSKNFPDVDTFMEEFGNLKEASQVTKLHEILKPYLLRRMKEDVETSIAPKEETIIEVELTTIQKKYYKAILERNFDHLVAGKTRAALPSLLNVMMQLRKCCNHPFLLKGVEEAEVGPIDPDSDNYNDLLIESSGKLVLIDKLLPRLKEEGHKILIFSQMVRVLDILEDYLNYKEYKHERIDGSIRGNERQAAIDRFSKDKDILVFLLCTRAGGVGINLTAADTVIIFDSDWNPQNDLQAQARCHRIGQDKAVKVYRLLTRNTYERNMFERASLKLGLDQAVLNRSHDEDGESKPKFSTQEVDLLLKYGVYDLFRDDDTNFEKFREENIEDILARRTTRVVHENNEGSTFSKALFSSNDANMDLDIDDPDFWKKVMPDVADKPDPNIIQVPRTRKQVYMTDIRDAIDSDDEQSLEQDDKGMYSEDSEDSDEDMFLRKTKSRKSQNSGFVDRDWNITQRNRFLKALILLGFGRWASIKNYTKLASKSLKELALYGRAYLRKVIEFANVKETEQEIIARIINCDNQKEELTEEPWVPKSKRQVKQQEKEKKLEKESAEDEDEEDEEGKKEEVIEWNLNTEECEEDIKWFCEHDPSLNEPKFLDIVKTGAAQTLKRFELLVEIGKLVRSGFSEFDYFPEIDGGNFFESWWGVEEDRDLLIGTYKWGFGKYAKIIKDQELCFYNKVKIKDEKKKRKGSVKQDEDEDEDIEEDKEKNEIETETNDQESNNDSNQNENESSNNSDNNNQQSELKELPPFKILTHRVKHLLKAFNNMRKKKARLESKGKSEKQKKKEEKENMWSKREKNDFYRVITTYGIPLTDNGMDDFEFVKTKAKLTNKNLSSIQKFYIDFLDVCKFVKTTKWGLKKPLNSNEDKATEALKNENQSQESNPPPLNPTEAKAQEMGYTYVQSKRAFERLALFIALRKKIFKYLTKEEIIAFSSNISKNDSYPKWWNPKHDLGLLEGINKHGFGKWKEISNDQELPFYEILKGQKAQRKVDIREILINENEDRSSNNNNSEVDNKANNYNNDELQNILPKDKLIWKKIMSLIKELNNIVDEKIKEIDEETTPIAN